MRSFPIRAAWLFFLLLASASAGLAQTPPTFQCGMGQQGEINLSGTMDATDPMVEARIVFVTFPGYASALPTWSESFRSELASYVQTMSRGAQTLNVSIVTPPGSPNSAWVAANSSTYYAAGPGYGGLNTEIMTAIANAIPGVWTGVEQVFVLHYQCTFPCTDPSSVQSCESTCPYGGISTLLNGSVPGFTGTGTTQRFYYPLVDDPINENLSKWVVDHEYGHKLGLGHTPGTSYATSSPEFVNDGRYDVMRSSASVVNQESSLPYHAEHFNTLNWVPRTIISGDMPGVRVPDMRGTGAQIIRVTVPGSSQYFECANYQGGNLFDNKYQGTGLLITHVIPGIAWDIESAAGKFTAGAPDPVSGKDALEANPYYLGSAADFFDGTSKTTFNPGTNPNTNLYSTSQFSAPQSVKTSVAFENIRRDTNGDMLMDVYVTPKQTLASPNGGEILPKGQAFTITWNPRPATALITTVDLQVSTNGGASYSNLATGLSNTGSFVWTPGVVGSQYRIKVISHDQAGGTGTDESDANFSVVDHGNWQLLVATHPSGGRTEHGATYDSLRSRLILFGGTNLSGNFNDVWTKSLLGTAAWTQLTTSGTAPSARYDPAVVYDRARDRMLVFGGRTSGFSPVSDGFALTLAGTPTWSALPSNPFFTFGADRRAIYDVRRDRMVVVDPDFGVVALGLSGTPAWSQLTNSLPPNIGELGYTLVYDSARDKLVIFGGWTPSNNPYIYFNGLDEFDLATNAWTALSPSNSPHARAYTSAIYDPLRSRMVLFGGYYYEAGTDHYLNDTWAVPLGATPAWTTLTPGGTAPSARKGHSGTYDSIDDALVVFGGQTSNSTFAQDTRALVFPDIRPPAASPYLSASGGCENIYVDWGATGDDGSLGTATSYDLRWSSSPITTEAQFSGASAVPVALPTPGPPWTQEEVAVYVGSCSPHKYFAVRIIDDAGNASPFTGDPWGGQTACVHPPAQCYESDGKGPIIDDGGNDTPAVLAFAPPSPNPTESSATFEFSVPRDLAGSRLELGVFDVLGRRIRSIRRADAVAGTFTTTWDLRSEAGTRVSPGLYFARLIVGERKITRSVLVR